MHHPHHVIPKIFALANAFMDEKIVGSKLKAVSTSPRTNTAKALLDAFKGDDNLRPIVDQWEKMSTGEHGSFYGFSAQKNPIELLINFDVYLSVQLLFNSQITPRLKPAQYLQTNSS